MPLKALLLILLVCVLASPAFADFEMTAGVNAYLEYNDNIFLDSEDEEDDVITTVSPNISLTWETSRLDLSLFASVSMEKYMDNTDEDRIGAGEANQAASLNALARLYRELFFLRVSDTYSRVPIDEGGRGGENNRTVNLTDSNTLSINPYLQFQVMKDTQMQVGYTYTNVWYEEEEGNDAISHLYSTSLTKELSPRATMTLSGSHKQYRPKDANKIIIVGSGGTYDFDQESVSLNLKYQATERLNLNGTYGHTWLDYDVRGKGDTDEWLAGADYEITSNYTVGMQYSKSVNVSVNDGTRETYNYSANLKYDDRFTINFRLFAASDYYAEVDRDADSYGGVLSGELPFNEKTGINGLFSYTNYDSTGDIDEQYDRYSTRLSLYYETRLGRLSTGYIYNRNESDFDNEDYDNNIVFVSASFKF